MISAQYQIKKEKISNRGRNVSVAAIITSSPYKNNIVDKNKKKEEKENKLKNANNKKHKEKKTKGKQQKPKTKTRKSSADSDDEEDILFDTDSEPDALVGQEVPDSGDAECMFCTGLFSQDSRGETWIKCIMCGLWAHGDCAAAEFDTRICDFCK